MTLGDLEARQRDGALHLGATGDWTIETATGLRSRIKALTLRGKGDVVLDLAGLGRLDSTGAWLLLEIRRLADAVNVTLRTEGASAPHAALLERIAALGDCAPAAESEYHPLIALVERTGKAAYSAVAEATDLLYFLGVTTVAGLRSILQPRRIRFVSVLSHIEHTGLDALPIVGLLSFLIGVVVSYQGSDQLARFGAEIFTINLLGVSILREMGILLAAIVVAGRSGSAFAAQIGTMQVNQEVDAMNTLGLDPVEMLVLPRVIALVIAMPLLAVYSDLMGLIGGLLMAIVTLDVSLVQFIERLHDAVGPSTFWVGILKAPVFGLLIALVGCREGLKVTGSAESVGLHTTRAVVISIFLVIVADAVFSITFSVVGW